MNYRDYLQASDMKHSNSINSYAWFRNLRKLVKQSAFSMLLKALKASTLRISQKISPPLIAYLLTPLSTNPLFRNSTKT